MVRWVEAASALHTDPAGGACKAGPAGMVAMASLEVRLPQDILVELGSCQRRARTLDQTQAMGRFLAGIERRAYRMAQIAVGDADEALDIVQDAMLKLVERYSARSEAEWTPLFYRILQSRILDWHRRNMVRNRLRTWFGGGAGEEDDADDPLQNVPDVHAPDPAKQVLTKRAAQALDEALRKLPLRQQQAFLLRAWEELDVAQTARVMGCSEGSVKTHYSRAVHRLRKRLGEHWP